MPIRWNEGDIIALTADCELGERGQTLHVIATAGAYMTARTVPRDGRPGRFVRTGRDYALARKVGHAPVDPHDALEIPDVAAGAYRIDRDVTNPCPDRRMTRDWTKSPVWAAGTEFVVREQQRMSRKHLDEYVAGLDERAADALRARNTFTVIELAGDHYASLHRVGPGNAEQYAALAAALVPTKESIEQFMTRVDCSIGFVAWLVGRGLVSRSDLETWWRRYQYGDDTDAPAAVGDDVTTLDEPVIGEG